MATAESVKTQLTALLNQANGTTGKTDETLTAAIASLAAGFGQGGGENQIERGNFVADSTKEIMIPCEFEPDVVLIKRVEPLNTDGDYQCLFALYIVKNWFKGGRYISGDGSTALSNGSVGHDISGYGETGIEYAEGMLFGAPKTNARYLLPGYSYNYIFGRFGL